ncbi:MAG: DUF488 domain-containing protein [Reyranellaceae bacterium]
MALSSFRIGGEAAAEKAPKGALRLATVRYLPRGLSAAERKKRDLYDVWLPLLAPSPELLSWAKGHGFPGGGDEKTWQRFSQRFAKEMTASAEKREALKMLALLARKTDVSVGCYCADESRCHRSVLKKLIESAG